MRDNDFDGLCAPRLMGEKTYDFECPTCGNHVCAGCAKSWGGLCPNCFSKLYRVS